MRDVVEEVTSDPRDTAAPAPTARERFEASARKIARTAETLECRRWDWCRETYDAVPFGLKRRIPTGILLREGERREIHPASEEQALARIRSACFELARRLLKEMIEIDAELARLPETTEGAAKR